MFWDSGDLRIWFLSWDPGDPGSRCFISLQDPGDLGSWIFGVFLGPWDLVSWIFVSSWDPGDPGSWLGNFCMRSRISWILARWFSHEILQMLDLEILLCHWILWILDPVFARGTCLPISFMWIPLITEAEWIFVNVSLIQLKTTAPLICMVL